MIGPICARIPEPSGYAVPAGTSFPRIAELFLFVRKSRNSYQNYGVEAVELFQCVSQMRTKPVERRPFSRPLPL